MRFSKRNDLITLDQANFDFDYVRVYEMYKIKNKKMRSVNIALSNNLTSKNNF